MDGGIVGIFFQIFVVALVSSAAVVENSKSTKTEDNVKPFAAGYYVSVDTATQEQAISKCVTIFGGHLATIRNENEFDAAVATMKAAGVTSAWTAGRYVDGNWEWMTNHLPISSSQLFWYPGLPAAPLTTYPALYLFASSDYIGYANYYTSLSYNYLCQVL